MIEALLMGGAMGAKIKSVQYIHRTISGDVASVSINPVNPEKTFICGMIVLASPGNADRNFAMTPEMSAAGDAIAMGCYLNPQYGVYRTNAANLQIIEFDGNANVTHGVTSYTGSDEHRIDLSGQIGDPSRCAVASFVRANSTSSAGNQALLSNGAFIDEATTELVLPSHSISSEVTVAWNVLEVR